LPTLSKRGSGILSSTEEPREKGIGQEEPNSCHGETPALHVTFFKLFFKHIPGTEYRQAKMRPDKVSAYIEIVPADAVKYEIRQSFGALARGSTQRCPSLCPTLYGFIPQTYCGKEVAALCAERTGVNDITGRWRSNGHLRTY